jgi:nicotinamide phosphoribosyltransferase
MGGCENEVETFKRLITEVYPSGIVSIVSDTWDFWKVVNPSGGICAELKSLIMARDGKVVIRPDSGDPVRIVAGYTSKEIDSLAWPTLIHQGEVERVICQGKVYEYDVKASNERQSPVWKESKTTILEVKGMIQCLWEIFGGTTTSTGFRQLDQHIGAIYGDSITLGRAEKICSILAQKGFASTNVVYGIGSFTYQGAVTKDAIITRDTHGFAVKSTYGEVLIDGERQGVEIFKDPATDDGLKKSAKGLIAVYKQGNSFVMKDQASWSDVRSCSFLPVFQNGLLMNEQSLSEIRAKVAECF